MFIYFIESGPEGAIRIGQLFGSSIEDFIKRIQVGNPVKLNLLLLVDTKSYTEASLFTLFNRYKLENGWFERHPRLILLITKLKENPNFVMKPLRKRGCYKTEVWTEEKLEFLRNNYLPSMKGKGNKLSKRSFAKQIGMDWSQVQRKARSLGL